MPRLGSRIECVSNFLTTWIGGFNRELGTEARLGVCQPIEPRWPEALRPFFDPNQTMVRSQYVIDGASRLGSAADIRCN